MEKEKILFTEEEKEILTKARDILFAKYEDVNYRTPAYYLVKPSFFSVDDLVSEMIYTGQSGLENER